MELVNVQVSYHRNGSYGNGFHVVLFDAPIEGELRHFVATVFKGQGNVAILESSLLADGVFKFGENSWRCESFEEKLRAEIAKTTPLS